MRVLFDGVPAPLLYVQSQQIVASWDSMQGAILNADGTPNSAANPARPGDVVAIFGTGGGPTSPPGINGGIATLDPLSLLTLPVTVQLGAHDAEVVYAGAVPTLTRPRKLSVAVRV